jgi:hypothetical protein
VWFDPMLEEFAASQVMRRAADASARDTPPYTEDDYDEAATAPAMTTLCTTGLPLSMPVKGTLPPTKTTFAAGEVAPREVGEVRPSGFEPAMHTAGTSTPTRGGHPDGQATPDPSTRRTTHNRIAKPCPALVTRRPRRVRPLDVSHDLLRRCKSSEGRPYSLLHQGRRRQPRGPCHSGAADGLPLSCWRTYRPSNGARYSSGRGWEASHHRQPQFLRRPNQHMTPYSLGT